MHATNWIESQIHGIQNWLEHLRQEREIYIIEKAKQTHLHIITNPLNQ